MKIHNLNVRIEYPATVPDLAPELQAFLLNKYKNRDVDGLMGKVQEDVTRFVVSKWRPVITVGPA